MPRNIFHRSTEQLSILQKSVVELECQLCNNMVCDRGMRAILLADAKVELYSTDCIPARAVQLVGEDYVTNKCCCRIQDAACSKCGNIVGYHVTTPCKSCMLSCHNGHLWMYHSYSVKWFDRLNGQGDAMTWKELTTPATTTTDIDTVDSFVLCGR